MNLNMSSLTKFSSNSRSTQIIGILPEKISITTKVISINKKVIKN